MTRKDWHVGRLHFIARKGKALPRQIGVLAWGYDAMPHTAWTVDVFIGRSLWTARWDKRG